MKKKDFLLTHYHDDHFNGAIYMATTTPHRFNNVYISDVWNMPGSVYVTSLTLLRGIFTRSVILGENTIISILPCGLKKNMWLERHKVCLKSYRLS